MARPVPPELCFRCLVAEPTWTELELVEDRSNKRGHKRPEHDKTSGSSQEFEGNRADDLGHVV